jgi:AcrR family transcriptional regulator
MASQTRRSDAQTEKRAAIERAVLDATEALLAEGASYADLGIERIATRAGIKRTAFYFYFRDKRELLMRLTEGIADQLYAEADTWWSGEGDGAQDLERALGSILTLYREHSALLRAVVEAAAYDDAIAGFWRALVQRFVDATERRIAAEQAAGRIDPMPARETAFALAWMTERTCYQQLVQDGDLADEKLVQALVGAWTRAVYGRAPSA